MTRQETYKLIEDHYRKHSTTLVKKLSYRMGQESNAKDIVQEAYTRACAYWDSYKPDLGTFDSWFNSILSNAATSFFKEEILRGMTTEKPIETVELPNAPSRVMVGEVEKYIKDLPTGSKKTIAHLFFLSDYSYSDIERIVPENMSNIRKIVQRIREEMRPMFISEVK